MSILPTFPGLLWLLGLIALPVLVHLFARSRPPAYRFSNIEFLNKILKKTARLRKPQDWLTLVLRTLAVAALVFAFLHPLLLSNSPDSLPGNDKNLIIIIDQSASMAAKEGPSSRFESACAEANSLLESLQPDQANIVWIKAKPNASFPNPGSNLSFLRQQLQQANAVPEVGSINAALKLASEQLMALNGSREIILISDFQSAAWKDVAVELPASIKLTTLKVGQRDLPNIALTSLTCSPASPVRNQACSFTTRVQNFSDQATSTTVYLNAGGSRQSKTIELPAWSQTEVSFPSQFNKHGQVSVHASLSEDSFPDDDQRHLVVPVREALRLVSVAAEPNASTIVLDRVASALSWLSHSTQPTLPAASSCHILFLHAWDGKHLDTLDELSRSTTIIAEPGLECPAESTAAFLSTSTTSTRFDVSNNKEGWTASISDEDASVFRLFKSGEFGNPAQGRFSQRVELPKVWQKVKGLTTLLAYQDQTPAMILQRSKQAPRLIWNLPFNPNLSDWTQHEPFLPFLAELILSIQPFTQQLPTEALTGASLSWALPDNLDADSVTLLPPAGDALPTTMSVTEQGAQLKSVADATPGIFQWMTGSTVAETSYSNFPNTKSDLRQLSKEDLKLGEAADADAIVRADKLANGLPLWPWLIGACLLFLIAESVTSTARKATTEESSTAA